jgi:hypothetical protein
MEFVSSDTSAWIDFSVIQRTEIPFRLPYTYIMNTDAIENELLSPTGLRDELLRCGLVGVGLEIEEFELAESFGLKYLKLSIYDRIALSIAKVRNITLLTGDGALTSAPQWAGGSITKSRDSIASSEITLAMHCIDCIIVEA